MVVYLINIFLILLYAIFIKDKKKFCILVSIQLFLILAFRSVDLGVDLSNYNSGFNYIKNLNFTNIISRLNFFSTADLIYPFDYESGYVVLNWVVSHLGFSFHGFLIICALINILSFGYFIYKYSDIPWLSFIILCTFGTYTYFFGIIRQSLALSIFILSIHLAIKNKKFPSFMLFLIAFIFHRTILILLPIYFFINNKTITRKKFLIILVLSFPFLLISGFLYSKIVYPLMTFFGKGYVGHGIELNNLILLLYIISFAIVIFGSFNQINNKQIMKVSVWAVLLSVFVEILGLYNDNFARVVPIYNAFLIISIPGILKQYDKQRIVGPIKMILVLALSYFLIYSVNDSEIVPYKIETKNIMFEREI